MPGKTPATPSNLDAPVGTSGLTTPVRRPGWITGIILLMLISVAQDLWGGAQAIRAASWDSALMVLQSGLYIASVIGLWRMKKWGAALFVAGTLVGFLVRWPLAFATSPEALQFLQSRGFWCLLVFVLALYFLIFRGLFRMWRKNELS